MPKRALYELMRINFIGLHSVYRPVFLGFLALISQAANLACLILWSK